MGWLKLKVILPLARIENAYQRVTGFSPMLEICGKPIIAHLLDQVIPLKPEEIVFIVGDVDKEVISFVKTYCNIPFRFIKQKLVRGSAHAILGAKGFVKGPVMILFSDTLFDKKTVKNFSHKDNDCIIWVSEVADPRPLGVVFMDGEFVSRLIEKPDEPVSNQAMVGLYAFKDADVLFDHIKYLLDNDIKTKGEFYLTDAIQLMINDGLKVKTRPAIDWVDIDSEGGVLRANERLCKSSGKVNIKPENSVIIPPVHIEKGAVVKNSIIGPHVSIASSATVSNSIVKSSVIGKSASLRYSSLAGSVLASKAKVKGHLHNVNVQKDSTTFLE